MPGWLTNLMFSGKNFLFFLLLLASCTEEKKENPVVKPEDSLPGTYMMITTAMPVKPVPLMLPFHLDSLSIRDTSNYFFADLYFPVTNFAQDKLLNELVLKLVKSQTEGYGPGPRKEEETVSVDVWVSEMAMNKNLVSFCFTDQNFTQGAAHFNHGYSTLNYNTKTGKQVFLENIFRLNTKKQKEDFCAIVNPTEEGLGPNQLETEDLKHDADFIIRNGNIIFYFDDYEKGPSMEQRIFDLKSFENFLLPEYGWLVE